MGVGAKASTPININSENITCEKQKANQGVESLTFNTNIAVDNGLTSYDPYSAENEYYNSWSFYTATKQNEAFSLYYRYYGQEYLKINTRTPTVYTFDSDVLGTWPIGIQILKVNPNGNLNSSILNYTIVPNLLIAYKDNVPEVSRRTNVKIRTETYITSNSLYENIYNQTYAYNQNAQIYARLRTNEYSSVANKTVEETNIQTTGETRVGSWYSVNRQLDGALLGRATTYIIILQMLSIQTDAENIEDVLLFDAQGQNTAEIKSLRVITPLNLTGKYTTGNITTEVVDIPGLMWQILTMPFAFMSQAFNLTLFPGTNYSINVSNIIIFIFGMLILITIFKLIAGKFK